MGERSPLLNGIAPPGNSFALPEHRVVYISVTKAACTAMRWMIAGLAGEDAETFYQTPVGHQTRLMTIHNRSRWQHTPQLKDLPPSTLAEISPDDGWFVFAVVRDPHSRLWSGWQSKFLVRHGRYVRLYADQPWFPRVPERPEDVVEDFHRFVEARPWETHPELRRDVHFLPQVRSVRPAGINYTRIYDVTELGKLFTDLTQHLEAMGLPADLDAPRANETPLPLTRAALTRPVQDVIRDAYRDDFESFGHMWGSGGPNLADEAWSPDAIRLVQYHVAANERIRDLSKEAQRLRKRLAKTRQRLRRLEQVGQRPRRLRTPPLRSIRWKREDRG